jgi:hypothetical protein
MENYGCGVSDHWLDGKFVLAKHRTAAKTAFFLRDYLSLEANVKP